MKGAFWDCFSSIHCHWQRIPPDLVKALCGKFVWQLLAQGGSEDNSAIHQKHLRAAPGLCEDNRALPRVITTASVSWMSTQEETTKGTIQFFFWVLCFINLHTNHHLFHSENQISTWFSLPVTKQKMLCVCPQSHHMACSYAISSGCWDWKSKN